MPPPLPSRQSRCWGEGIDLAKSGFLNAVFIFINFVDGYYTLGSAHIVSVQLRELSPHEHV